MAVNDKKFLIIDSRPYGLFSIFLHTIDNIKWAHDNNYVPVVRWGPGRRDPNHGRAGAAQASQMANPSYVTDRTNFVTDETPGSWNNTPGLKHCQCLYWDEKGWRGSLNPWEYYFEPLNEYTVENAENSEHDVADIFMVGEFDFDLENKFLIANLHSYEPLALWQLLERESEAELPHEEKYEFKHRAAVAEVISNNVVVKPEIVEKIDNFYNKNFSGNVLGVHVRGTDKKLEYPHKALPISAYIEAIEEYLQKQPDSKIYVASDNNEAIIQIFKRFGPQKVFVTNATRMQNYLSADPICLTPSTGPKHGEEVLIECMLLSKTNHLICTDSNVAASALYINPHITTTYLNRKHGK
ncbi:MAG TPA: hypothetical protein DHV22_14320 [Xanthomarina gelatinilytica]|uniref:Alpha-(1,6)-fucosyltransferase N- and catalytic domain-containing protein n=1 Tax=Xanthomarina gelatinilytica TaxID=1137281 RepID=A0A3D6BTT9_9FLAO|nr:hypothetical protein [Xanthomarina gelatinilytica]